MFIGDFKLVTQLTVPQDAFTDPRTARHHSAQQTTDRVSLSVFSLSAPHAADGFCRESVEYFFNKPQSLCGAERVARRRQRQQQQQHRVSRTFSGKRQQMRVNM